MLVELILAGVGRDRPLVLHVNQLVVRQDNGTPVAVALEAGESRIQIVAKVGDPDFQRILRAAGTHEQVLCDWLELPKPPAGARLVAGPRDES